MVGNFWSVLSNSVGSNVFMIGVLLRKKDPMMEFVIMLFMFSVGCRMKIMVIVCMTRMFLRKSKKVFVVWLV